MYVSRATFLTAISSLACCSLLPDCAQGSAKIHVGSKDFTEEMLVGEMYAQLLEHHGLPVQRRFGLGGTQVAMAAMQSGSIDLYPEYTGTGLLVILKEPFLQDESQVFAKVAREYQQRYHITWLDPAPMNDSQALAVSPEVTRQYGLRTVSDLAHVADHLRLGAVPEFYDRPDGLPALQKVYPGLKFQETRLLDDGVKYQALAHHDVDVVVAFSTDGQLAVNHDLVLIDDRHVWPQYHVAPVVRDAMLEMYPQIRSILHPLANVLTDGTMRALNANVDVDKKDVADVVTLFLRSRKLVTA